MYKCNAMYAMYAMYNNKSKFSAHMEQWNPPHQDYQFNVLDRMGQKTPSNFYYEIYL